MFLRRRKINYVLGGGGVKGIAYAGVFKVAESLDYGRANIAGVSAGAIAGSFAAVGYSSGEMLDILERFDLEKVDITTIKKRLPVIGRFLDYTARKRYRENKVYGLDSFKRFLQEADGASPQEGSKDSSKDSSKDRSIGDILKGIATYMKEGYLYDGDYVEEWIYKTLAARGYRTFADLRTGYADKSNPRGYRVRMTAVDYNRTKVLILPDDMAFYGIDPDRFEIARAVRMSTAVPFVFKSVEVKKTEGGNTKTYHIVDGGVLDQFPFWAIDNSLETVGFTLNGGDAGKLFTLDNALSIFKGLVSAVHDIGVPKDTVNKIKYMGAIDTSKVGFLDFHIDKADKEYLYNAGVTTAREVFGKMRTL